MHSYSIDSSERERVSLYIALISVLISLALHTFVPPYLQRFIPESKINIPWLVSVPSAFAVYGLLSVLFEKYLWKISYALGITKIPNLNGEWSACMKSSRDNFQNEFCVDAVIHQTWSRIKIILENEDLRSHSWMASLKSESPNEVVFSYTYWTESKPRQRDKISDHNGTCHVRVNLKEGRVRITKPMAGEYYNDHGRGSYGEITFVRKKD
jgi:SMODS-associating 2TM, beta-strand rich effector domain